MKMVARLAILVLTSTGGSFANSTANNTCLDMQKTITDLLLTIHRYENRSINLDASMALIEHLYFETQKTRLKELAEQFKLTNCSSQFADKQ